MFMMIGSPPAEGLWSVISIGSEIGDFWDFQLLEVFQIGPVEPCLMKKYSSAPHRPFIEQE